MPGPFSLRDSVFHCPPDPSAGVKERIDMQADSSFLLAQPIDHARPPAPGRDDFKTTLQRLMATRNDNDAPAADGGQA